VKTGAARRLFGVIALERLEFQILAIFDTTDGGFFDETITTGVDIVDTTADFVVATNLFFNGFIAIGSASPFVLEGFLTFDPSATESAFDHASAIGLSASNGTGTDVAVFDGAFVDDIIFEKAITIVQSFAAVDATSGLGYDFLATSASAVEPGLADFEGVASTVLFAVFHASDQDQFAAVVDSFLAFVHAIILRYFFFFVDTFSRVNASLILSLQCWFGASSSVGLTNVEIIAIFKRFSGFVLLTISDASRRFEGQIVAIGYAFTTVIFVIVVATDRDSGKIFGDASFGHHTSTLANVDETSAFDFGSFGVSTGASAAGSRISGLGQGHRSCHKAQSNRKDLHDHFLLVSEK
jgi:hypothetical protein